MPLPKLAFIVQRYGLEVNGGAEYHCRILAERLTDRYDVTVLTTCAQDYTSWANVYPPGLSVLNGVTVRRFATPHPRDEAGMARSAHKLAKWSQPDAWRGLSRVQMWGRALVGKSIGRYSRRWARQQGPYVPGLIDYLRREHRQYDALIFFTYLYYPTIEGLRVAPRKSILIPTAHDEPPIYLPVFSKLFGRPRAMLYNTRAEQQFVQRLFHNESVYSDIVGVGVDPPWPATYPARSVPPGTDYLIYIGRIDTAKGCATLFDWFRAYKQQHPSALKLVLVGQAFMPIPADPDLVAVGFVDEGEKTTLLQGARALVMPSAFESLSMVALESFAAGIPVVANADSAVLRDHIDSSGAGFLYNSAASFADALGQLATADRNKLATNARAYVATHYTWDRVLARIDQAVAVVTGA
ncbi:glycosyltransferase family 4 protein [Spirosoma luteolum]